MINIDKIKIDRDEIIKRRFRVLEEFVKSSSNIKESNIENISPYDLKILFELYDKVFLDNQFKKNYEGKLKFSLSTRLNKSAGKTLCPRNIDKISPREVEIEIRIGSSLLFGYDKLEGIKKVGGIETKNSLEALLIIFEHEICHVIEFINFNKSSCRGYRFKTIAKNIFGHSESCHRLPTNRDIIRERFGFNIGDSVKFIFKNKKYNGILYGVNKRATVMVKDKKGTYSDSRGNRFTKYYVPIEFLEK